MTIPSLGSHGFWCDSLRALLIHSLKIVVSRVPFAKPQKAEPKTKDKKKINRPLPVAARRVRTNISERIVPVVIYSHNHRRK